MAEIINLRMARQAKQRSVAERQADENRRRFGQTKGEKIKARADADRLNRAVDGAKRSGDGSSED